MSDAVEIQGAKQFRRELRQFKGEWKKVVKQAHRAVAQVVIDAAPKAAQAAPPNRGPKHSVKGAMRLARSFDKGTTVAGQRLTGAIVRSKLPDAFGQEFGSWDYRQFPGWVGKGQPGRVGYKARDDNVDKIKDTYGEALMNSFKKAYPIRG